MTEYTILSQQDFGDKVKLVVKIDKDRDFFINGVKQTNNNPSDAEKETLANSMTGFDHVQNTITETIFLPTNYTDQQLSEIVDELINAMGEEEYSEATRGPNAHETVSSNGANQKSIYVIDKAPQAVIDGFTSVFPDVDLSTIGMISEAAYHDIIQEPVVTAFLVEWSQIALVQNGRQLLTKSRKYCMDQVGFYDREYLFCDETFDFLPPSANVIAKSENVNLSEGLTIPDFYDVYFDCDPDVAEEFFGLERSRGEHSTYYAVTVVDGQVVRKKQYVYDAPTVSSDWNDAYDRISAAHGVS